MASIEKRSENTYRITVSCGYDVKGKKIRQYKTITLPDTLTDRQKDKEIQKQASEFERIVENGTYLDGNKITFKEFIDIWVSNYAEKELAPSTLNPYKLRLEKRIIPALGHLKISKIQPHHLSSFYSNLADGGVRLDSLNMANDNLIKIILNENKSELSKKTDIHRKTFTRICEGKGVYHETAKKLALYFKKPISELFTLSEKSKGLSSKTIRHHHTLVSAILSTAVAWNIIDSNPASKVKLPKLSKVKQVSNYYDDEQIIELFIALEDEPIKYKTIVFLTIDTGMRLSEIAGLEWSDIELNNSAMSVTKQRQYVSNYGILERDPKSDSGVRTITISKMLVDTLKKYRTHQNEMKLKCGSAWFDSNNVFTHDDGIPIFPNRPSIWFNEFLKRKNLPKITFHGLRHPYVKKKTKRYQKSHQQRLEGGIDLFYSKSSFNEFVFLCLQIPFNL